jgi:hypothetical protein
MQARGKKQLRKALGCRKQIEELIAWTRTEAKPLNPQTQSVSHTLLFLLYWTAPTVRLLAAVKQVEALPLRIWFLLPDFNNYFLQCCLLGQHCHQPFTPLPLQPDQGIFPCVWMTGGENG